MSEKKYLSELPYLMKEWNWDKNNSISPTGISVGSNQKIWWKCSNGHEWQASIGHRAIRGQGCPFCSGRRAISGETDLATLNQKLAAEWHPTKNGALTPNQITIHSGKKIWWQCAYGHEWQATPCDRDRDNTGCPYCNARRQTSFPEQAIYFYIKKIFPNAVNRYRDIFSNSMELDIFIPDISVGIEYDGLRWHSTETQHLNEKTKYRICKECGVFLIRIKENNKSAWNDVADKVIFVEKRRNFAKLNKLISEILSYIVGIYNGAETMNLLNKNISVDVERDQEEINSYLTEIDESLAELRPDLVEEWDFEKNGRLLPSMFSLHSNDAVWWKCKRCGHSWRSLINSRTRPNGSGCAICGNTQKGTTFHKGYISVNGSLLQNNPELAEEWHPTRNGNLSPDNIMSQAQLRFGGYAKNADMNGNLLRIIGVKV